jgi:nanoRNase/pAp phosphatase (c-di-AMP/oligoRNAs hydrolase)
MIVFNINIAYNGEMNNETKLDKLAALLKNAPDEVFIQPHNVPDPDAIASSMGLQYLLEQKGVHTQIVYDQEIEKANAFKMIDLFNPTMIPASEAHTLGAEDWSVLVDAQKGNANITDLPTDEVASIDHHEYKENMGYKFEDIRPKVGSCSAIISEYFVENNITIPQNMATSLLYGIFMDTDNLTRGVNALDIDMFYMLYPLSNINLITELKGNEHSVEDLHRFADAFKTLEMYQELGFLKLNSSNDSLLGAAGDIVVCVAGINIVAAYAVRESGVKLSCRSITKKIKANDLVKYLVEGLGVGGGHDHMAGGFIPKQSLPDDRSIDTFLKHRTISFYEKMCGQL